MFYQGGPIDHCTHNTGPFEESSSQIYFNVACNELAKKDKYLVPEQAPLIIFDIKSVIYVANTCKDTKHTIHIDRIIPSLINGEELKKEQNRLV